MSATTKSLDDVNDLIALYALVSRIRLFASEPVIRAAEEFAARVTRRYGEASLSMEDLRNVTLSPHIDPLQDFSTLCREEMRSFPSQRALLGGGQTSEHRRSSPCMIH